MYITIWLVNSSLYFYLITSQREFPNRITQLCQRRTQWCQQITVQEHHFSEFALVHLWFLHLPNWDFPLHLPPLQWPGICAVDNLRCLMFFNSQSPENFTGKPKIVSFPDKFTGKRKTQINVYIYIYIAHHLQGQWHSLVSWKVLT